MLPILNIRPAAILLKIGSFKKYCSSLGAVMDNASVNEDDGKVAVKKFRYDGRVKKRKWENNRRNFNAIEGKKQCVEGETFDRVKRKKSIMLLSYSGANYYGMQRNPEMKTIEEDLLTAMLKAKVITEEAFAQIQTIQFQRAARTDKGVSAARQVVSLKLPDEVSISAINELLSEQIRVFSIKRVTKGFNAKSQCDARTYSYVLPTLAFASHDEVVTPEEYRLPIESRQRVNEILKLFEGTKNFHNFTSRKDFFDPSSKRFIMSFSCGEPFLIENMEFATIQVKGQSFMLHQIRKMVGLTLAVVRGLTTIDTIERAYTEDRLDLPMAPSLGLVLEQVHYDRYNERYGSDGIHEKLTWESVEPSIEVFVKEQIYPTIFQTEIKEKSMASWLETLPLHSYDVREKKDISSENEGSVQDDKQSPVNEILTNVK